MRKLYSKIDVSLIKEMPMVEFTGDIHVINNERDAQRAVKYLLRQSILGIDTETRPAFRKGVVRKVALLQVATHTECFLFRLNKIGLSASILKLLSSKDVLMVGLSLTDDMHQLHQRGDFIPGNFIDLQQQVSQLGIEDKSLRKLYANFFGQKISKRQQLSNWEAETLTPHQMHYAAIDAWACIILYEEFQHLLATGDYELEVVEEPEEEVEETKTEA